MWIESHPDLENHPKLPTLCELLKIDKRSAIGLLHQLWWWCTAYAEDGDLRKYGIRGVNRVLGIDPSDSSLIRSGFIDRVPYLRVHDWWDYYGRYLKLKYRNNSKELIRIENLCAQTHKTRKSHAIAKQESRSSQHTDVVVDVTDVRNETDVRTYPPKSTSSLALLKSTAGHGKTCTCEICWKEAGR